MREDAAGERDVASRRSMPAAPANACDDRQQRAVARRGRFVGQRVDDLRFIAHLGFSVRGRGWISMWPDEWQIVAAARAGPLALDQRGRSGSEYRDFETAIIGRARPPFDGGSADPAGSAIMSAMDFLEHNRRAWNFANPGAGASGRCRCHRRRHGGPFGARRRQLRPGVPSGVQRVRTGRPAGLARMSSRAAPGRRIARGLHEPCDLPVRRRRGRAYGRAGRAPEAAVFRSRRSAAGRAEATNRRRRAARSSATRSRRKSAASSRPGSC